MIVSVLQETLAKGLSIVSPAVSPRSTLPVLGNVLLATGNGKLHLSATNLEIAISCQISGNVSEDGGVTLPARTLGDLVAALPPGRVIMSLTQQTQTLCLQSDRTTAHIKGIDMQEFPTTRRPGQDDHPISLDAKQLGTAIRQVVIAAATDESRPILTGVLMKFEHGRLTMAAADGFRLSARSIPAPRYSGDTFQLIVPAKALAQVARLCGESETVDFYRVGTRAQQVMFQFGDIVLVSQLIAGNFPDYRQIIPDHHETVTETEIDTAAFLKACKAARIFARDSSHIAQFHIKPSSNGVPGTMTISAKSAETGDDVNEIDAKIKGEEIEAAFNVKYLIEFLSAVKTPRLVLKTTTAASPGAFRPAGNEDYVHVIMPMHMQRKQAPPVEDVNAG